MGGGLAIAGVAHEGGISGLRTEDGVITELGPGVGPAPGDELIDATGLALVPGMINAHTHAAMTLFRGYADDLTLMEWLERHIWPAEARLEPDDVYWGTRLACLEMIRNGTVAFWDMYWHPGATARAASDAGLRAVIGGPVIAPEGTAADADAQIGRSLAELEDFSGDPLIRAAISPHAIYTVAPETLRRAAEIAAERDLPLQIHLSETEGEVEDCLAAHGRRPAEHLDRLGFLGPRTALAHGVWLNDSELELIAERGATVVTNPVANMKLAVGGVFPYRAARERSVAVALGTDGPGSNNSLDLFADAKAFALLQKHASGDPGLPSAEEALAIARGQRSALIGGLPLEVGRPADFLLVRAGDPALVPGELEANLAYAASGAVVATTVVAGRVLMRDGRIEGAEEVIERARERFGRLLGPN